MRGLRADQQEGVPESEEGAQVQLPAVQLPAQRVHCGGAAGGAREDLPGGGLVHNRNRDAHLVRGGASESDLIYFYSYLLNSAKKLAQNGAHPMRC